jgi:hypothetical protein
VDKKYPVIFQTFGGMMAKQKQKKKKKVAPVPLKPKRGKKR